MKSPYYVQIKFALKQIDCWAEDDTYRVACTRAQRPRRTIDLVLVFFDILENAPTRLLADGTFAVYDVRNARGGAF